MAACRSSLENTRKMNLTPVLNKTSPELDVLGVPGKLVNYVVYSFKKKKLIFYFFFSLEQAIQTAIDHFLVSRNFRVNP
jgi:hypothetical protein